MAALLYAKSVRVAYGLRTVLDIDELEIRDGARVGLVGANGAGKTTLLCVLSGERAPDAGEVTRACRCAVVRQFGAAEAGAQGGEIAARLRAGEEREGLSGGEMERIRIARALETRAPLLLVDEPTTNLDFEGRAQVESLLRAHKGAMVLVSHDRALLDALCTEIWALNEGKIRLYPGNYTQYRQQAAREYDFALFEYRQYRQEQARLRALMSEVREDARQVRKAPKRMGNSEARLQKASVRDNAQEKLQNRANAIKSRINNLEEKQRPQAEREIKMTLGARGGVTSQVAARAERLTLRAGGTLLLRGASFTLPTGRRTVIVGPNGCGKTTLLRALRQGAYGVKCSPGVKIGWFGQETLDSLDESKTLLENVLRACVLPEHEARIILSRMGLRASDMQKPARVLSGGERAKAVIAALLSGDANLLLLDEPGNHLDLPALEALEEMLAQWQGTLALVSHDRRMIDRVAQRLLLFENGALIPFEGTLAEYERRKTQAGDERLALERARMRMAEVASRLSSPRKGDDPEALEREYQELIARVRVLSS